MALLDIRKSTVALSRVSEANALVFSVDTLGTLSSGIYGGYKALLEVLWLYMGVASGASSECQLGRLMPYHLATPAYSDSDFTVMRAMGQANITQYCFLSRT
jgi:hypothetical protein